MYAAYMHGHSASCQLLHVHEQSKMTAHGESCTYTTLANVPDKGVTAESCEANHVTG